MDLKIGFQNIFINSVNYNNVFKSVIHNNVVIFEKLRGEYKMEKTAFKKSSFATTLLVLLTFSVIASNTALVQADRGGEGKFVSVNIIGGVGEESPGTVTLLKLSSGEEWVFPLENTGDSNIDIENERVKTSAGTVQLIADVNTGYEFSRWVAEDGSTIEVENPQNIYEFKTSRGTTTITAVFELSTYKISYSVLTEGGNVSLTNNPDEAIAPPNSDPAIVEVVPGGDQMFWFFADDGYFVSAILVDKVSYVVPSESGFGLWYEFIGVSADHSVEVSFSEIGEPVGIPVGAVTLFVGEGASLTFANSDGGFATAMRILDFPDGTALTGIVWDIQNSANDTADGLVTITFYSDAILTEVIVASSLNATYCDVTGDGIINGDDVSDVANAVKSTTPNGPDVNPLYDVNNDGELTEDDVHRVNEHKWETVEYLTPTLISGGPPYYYEVETGHFSVFRAR
jgi:hypothetical protein